MFDENRRLSILNNPFIDDRLRGQITAGFVEFEGQLLLTTQQVAMFYGVEERTIQRLIEDNRQEIERSGYRNLKGAELVAFRQYVNDKNVVNIKTPVISVFTFKAFLNAGMLLKGSESAREIRQLLLDTTIMIIHEKTGGNAKYINQRDENFLPSLFNNESYNTRFKKSLTNHVDMGSGKYPKFNNLVYKTVFKESAQKYKEILELDQHDNTRDTMYSEVLNAISSVENGVASLIEIRAEELGRKLHKEEAESVFMDLENNPFLKPQIEDARTKMASFDADFRSKNHLNIAEYISPLNQEAYERFLGKKSKELTARIEDNIETFKRLRDK